MPLEGKQLPIYGDGKNIRDWLHVKDHCSAIDLVSIMENQVKFIILVGIMREQI